MEAIEFPELRELMVTSQLIARGIKDERVLAAMRKVPRHLFVGEDLKYRAYDDIALPTGEGQTISQPYMVAVMTELIEFSGDENVLEVGTGSGYQTAILAELSKEVFTIERYRSLSDTAKNTLTSLGYNNIHFMVGDGTQGWPEKAPFQRILITAAAPNIPETLIEQLSEGGIIVIPIGDRSSQQLVRGEKHKGKLYEEYHTPCVFVPLVGKYGWKEGVSDL